MDIKYVIIEIRRNLCCANFFLTLNQSIVESKTPVDVVLQSNNILIQCETDLKICVEKFFKIEHNSMNRLNIKDKYISFRTSLINEAKFLTNSVRECSASTLSLQVPLDESIQIVCSSCQRDFMEKSIKFKRLLPLPISSFDTDDWFCHKHVPLPEILPNDNDLLYGFFYILVNAKNICNTQEKDGFLHCNRCLQMLGQVTCSGKAFKMWDDSIRITSAVDQPRTIFEKVNDIEKPYFIINYILNQICISSDVHSMHQARILFQSVDSSRKNTYLLVNAMEKNLEILTNLTSFPFDNRSDLQMKTSYKVLFKVEKDDKNALLNFWKEDINVQIIEISVQMLSDLIESLIFISEIIPEEYRYSNGFVLSYVLR